MNLRDYVRTLRKRWRLVVSFVVVCLAAGVAYTLQATKMYEATAQIFVSTAGATDDTSLQQLAQGNTLIQARVQSYTSIANTPAVTSAVLRCTAANGIALSQQELKREISADAPLNKVLINVHVTDRSPQHAATLANSTATVFSNYIQRLEQTSIPAGQSSTISCQQENPITTGTQAATTPVRLAVTQPASIPAAPISPKTTLDLGLAFFVGLVIGVGAAVLRETLDNTVKSPEELSHLAQAPVLGVVPWDKRATVQAVSFRADAHGIRAEAFRTLRTNMQFIDVDKPSRIIAITSALPGEGKTHTALNLAAALAEAGQRVCLVEADLRKPTLAGLLGLVSEVGLTSTLIGRVPVESALQNAGRNLAVLTSGPVPPNPSELLVSTQFRLLLETIARSVDVILLDTAPLLPVADASEIAQLADSTVLAVRAGRTTRDQIRRARLQLLNVGVRPAGTVLSMAPARRTGAYSYYYSAYRPDEESTPSMASFAQSTTTSKELLQDPITPAR